MLSIRHLSGGGDDYVEPHLVAIADGVSKSKMRYKKYVKPEVSPLEGGVILMTSNVGDTTELGREIYIYLKKKCEESSDSKYTLSDSEGLTVQKKLPSAPVTLETEIGYAMIELVKLPDGSVVNQLNLYEKRLNGFTYFTLFEDGSIEQD